MRKQLFRGAALPLYLVSAFVADIKSHSVPSLVIENVLAANCVRADVKTFEIDVDGLCLPGGYYRCRSRSDGLPRRFALGARRRYRVSRRQTLYATVLSPKFCEGQLVRVCGHRHEIDASAISAAIDTDPYFSRMDTYGQHCYHACDANHFCRFIHPPEAVCERWGSILHQLYDDEQNLPPWRLAARLFLRESGLRFVGGAQDEEFVSTIVDILQHADGRTVQSRRRNPKKPLSRAALLAQKASGEIPLSHTLQMFRADAQPEWDPYATRATWSIDREGAVRHGVVTPYANASVNQSGTAAPEFRKRYQPVDVDDVLWAKVARTLHAKAPRDGHASASSQVPAAPSQVEFHADALERFVGQGKHQGSALRRKVLEWRFSEAGKAWQRQRESFLGAQACEDEPDLHDGETVA